jgi:hypothetical protein
MCGVLEAYYGDNTQISTPVNFYSATVISNVPLSTYNYLSYVKLPSSVNWTTYNNIFTNCYNLSKIVMPTTAPNLNSCTETFRDCFSLVDLEFTNNAPNITGLSSTFLNCISLKKINLPTSLNNCTTIADIVGNCRKLENITFPSINNLANFTSAFNGCLNLAWVRFTSLPTRLDTVMTFTTTFSGCSNLQNVYFPPLGTALSRYDFTNAFTGCPQLKTITFPSNIDVTSFNLVFSSCTLLARIILPNSTPSCVNFVGAFQNLPNLQDIVLPTTVAPNVNFQSAFSNCTRLETITIPSSYVFGNMQIMFSGCQSLKNLDWTPNNQDSLTTLNNCFAECKLLTNVTMPTSMNLLTGVNNLFNGCTLLESIVLPTNLNSVTVMTSTFQNCVNLKSVTMPTSMSSNTSFTSVFQGCNSLRSITLPNVVRSTLSTFNSCFRDCFSLQTVTFPNSQQLESISNIQQMFSNCSNLTTINNFNRIGSTANLGSILGPALANNRFTSISFVGKYSVLDLKGNNFVKADVQSVRLLNTNTGQWTGSSPQIDVSYTNMSTANLVQLFNDMALQGIVTSKTINITGATGTAGLTASDRLIITSKGWTITG